MTGGVSVTAIDGEWERVVATEVCEAGRERCFATVVVEVGGN